MVNTVSKVTCGGDDGTPSLHYVSHLNERKNTSENDTKISTQPKCVIFVKLANNLE